MNKKLPTNDIANELSGASVFFQSSPKSESPQESPTPKTKQAVESKPKATMTPRHHETTTPDNNMGDIARKNGTEPTINNEDTNAATMETIRKAVKQLGKEAATHRFTVQEKNVLADIVYTHTRQGYRTSENEITRIAVNWLILDYQEQGEQSVLARMLETLHK